MGEGAGTVFEDVLLAVERHGYRDLGHALLVLLAGEHSPGGLDVLGYGECLGLVAVEDRAGDRVPAHQVFGHVRLGGGQQFVRVPFVDGLPGLPLLGFQCAGQVLRGEQERADGHRYILLVPATSRDLAGLVVCAGSRSGGGPGGAGIAFGAAGGEPEQVAEAPDVAAGGLGFVQDAVFADGLGGDADGARNPGVGGRAGPHGGVRS